MKSKTPRLAGINDGRRVLKQDALFRMQIWLDSAVTTGFIFPLNKRNLKMRR